MQPVVVIELVADCRIIQLYVSSQLLCYIGVLGELLQLIEVVGTGVLHGCVQLALGVNVLFIERLLHGFFPQFDGGLCQGFLVFLYFILQFIQIVVALFGGFFEVLSVFNVQALPHHGNVAFHLVLH